MKMETGLPVSQGTGVASTPAGRAFMSRGREAVRFALAQKRPWGEMVDRSSFAKPESLGDATTRIRKNMSHFRINYAIIIVGIVALSLVLHPVSLFVLGLVLAGWTYLYLVRTEPLVAFGRTFSEREILVIMGLLSIVVVLMTSVGYILMSALLVGFLITAAHGAFRVPDDLFLDDQEASGGFLSFLGSGATGVPMVSHV
jgi:ABC-type multidrug transport system permease subunit